MIGGLDQRSTGLMVIDVQEKLFRLVDHSCQVIVQLQKMVHGARQLGLPILVTEQYPQGLGGTLDGLLQILPHDVPRFAKTSFSALGSAEVREAVEESGVDDWILCGIEAHVCVLQTAKDLKRAGKGVVVLNDAISSRSIYDFSTAIAEMRDAGIRVSSVETVLFEMVKDSLALEFKAMSELIK